MYPHSSHFSMCGLLLELYILHIVPSIAKTTSIYARLWPLLLKLLSHSPILVIQLLFATKRAPCHAGERQRLLILLRILHCVLLVSHHRAGIVPAGHTARPSPRHIVGGGHLHSHGWLRRLLRLRKGTRSFPRMGRNLQLLLIMGLLLLWLCEGTRSSPGQRCATWLLLLLSIMELLLLLRLLPLLIIERLRCPSGCLRGRLPF